MNNYGKIYAMNFGDSPSTFCKENNIDDLEKFLSEKQNDARLFVWRGICDRHAQEEIQQLIAPRALVASDFLPEEILECKCCCHFSRGVMHVKACCWQCENCNRRFKSGYFEHIQNCKAAEQEERNF